MCRKEGERDLKELPSRSCDERSGNIGTSNHTTDSVDHELFRKEIPSLHPFGEKAIWYNVFRTVHQRLWRHDLLLNVLFPCSRYYRDLICHS